MSEKPEKKSQNPHKPGKAVHYETLPEDEVHLRDFRGIKPGAYLTFIYSLALLLILFFVLILPGLRKPGAFVVLQTEPAGAAMRVDGVYRGSSPAKIFVSRGTHTIELVLPGFTPVQRECEIPGRIFASALFPRRFSLKVELTSPDYAGVLVNTAKDYASWTFGGEPTPSWQIPLSLSEGVYRIGAAVDRAYVDEILGASARFAVTKAALRDLIRAKVLSDNYGQAPSPISLCQSAGAVLHFLSQTPGAAIWLANTLPPDSASVIESSRWYKNQTDKAGEAHSLNSDPNEAASGAPARPPANRLFLGGLEYTGIPGGFLEREPPHPLKQQIPGFMICTTPLTEAAFDLFLKENPRWDSEYRQALVEQKLVTENYLINDKPAEISPDSVCSVSWFAARAYCQWLNSRLPPSMAGYEVRLPLEAEWEYALNLLINSNSSGMQQFPLIMDRLAEWCADPFVPLDYIPASPDAIRILGSPERSVRGGVNSANLTDYQTRASLPPAFCSSFVSFRPVITVKNPIWLTE